MANGCSSPTPSLIHQPDGPRHAVAYAAARGWMCSAFLSGGTGAASYLNRLALTVAFEGLFAGRAPGGYVLNGQYILIPHGL